MMEKPRKEPMLLNEWRQSPTAVCMIWTLPGNIILSILRVHTDLSPCSMVSPTLTARTQISKQITVSRTLSNLCLSLLVAPIPLPLPSAARVLHAASCFSSSAKSLVVVGTSFRLAPPPCVLVLPAPPLSTAAAAPETLVEPTAVLSFCSQSCLVGCLFRA